jgi:hypothetical protein
MYIKTNSLLLPVLRHAKYDSCGILFFILLHLILSYFGFHTYLSSWSKTGMTFGFIARQWKPISTLCYSELAFWAHLQKSKK